MKQPSLPSSIERNRLKIAGYLNSFGDVTLLLRELKGSNGKPHPFGVAGAGLYTLGGVNLALHADAGKSLALSKLKSEIADYIYEQTGHVSLDTRLGDVHEANVRGDGKLNTSLKKHAASNTMALYTAGAAAMMASGINKFRDGGCNPEERYKLAYGVSSLGFKLASLAIPESSKDEQAESSEKTTKNIVDYIKEKPLRIFGYGSLITELCLANEAWQDRNSNKAGFVLGAITAASYIMADLLVAGAHKDSKNASLSFSDEERADITMMVDGALAYVPDADRETMKAHIQTMIEDVFSESGQSADKTQLTTTISDKAPKSVVSTLSRQHTPMQQTVTQYQIA